VQICEDARGVLCGRCEAGNSRLVEALCRALLGTLQQRMELLEH